MTEQEEQGSAGHSQLFTVELSSSLGVIRGQVSVDPGPMRLSELVPTAFEFTDILVKRARVREERKGRKISCGPGCGVCCCQMVPLSPPEAFYLADLLDSMPLSVRRPYEERFAALINMLEQRGMIKELMDPEYRDEPVLQVAREYFYLGNRCPFLVDDACGIYEHRPVACREYNVVSSQTECRDPYRYSVEKVAMPLPMSSPLANLTAELTGTKPRLVPLALALRWSSTERDLRSRKWPGLQLFQAFMDRIGGPKPAD